MIRWKKHKIGYWNIKKMPVDELCRCKAGIIEMFNNESLLKNLQKIILILFQKLQQALDDI